MDGDVCLDCRKEEQEAKKEEEEQEGKKEEKEQTA